MQIFIFNRQALSNLDSNISYLSNLPQYVTSSRFISSINNSRANISAHYDISNRMFEAYVKKLWSTSFLTAGARRFLSREMMYSCAIFPELDADLKATPAAKMNGNGHAKLNGNGHAKLNGKMHRVSSSSGSDDELDELHEAQLRKISHIIQRAQIRPGHRVLEVRRLPTTSLY